MPKSLEMQIVGESLFNDGVGVVIFACLPYALRSVVPTPVTRAIPWRGNCSRIANLAASVDGLSRKSWIA